MVCILFVTVQSKGFQLNESGSKDDNYHLRKSGNSFGLIDCYMRRFILLGEKQNKNNEFNTLREGIFLMTGLTDISGCCLKKIAFS